MVRRLVEEQQVGLRCEGARERCARELAAGERLERPVEVGAREAEAADDGGGAVAPVVAAGVLEPRLRVGVAAERRAVVVARRHRPLEPAQLVLHRREIGRAGEHVLAQGPVALGRRALVVERDPRALLPGELAALQRHLARERAEERGLPGAVRTGQREPVSTLDLERDAVEQRLARELLPEVRCDEDCHPAIKISPRRVRTGEDGPMDADGAQKIEGGAAAPAASAVDGARAGVTGARGARGASDDGMVGDLERALDASRRELETQNEQLARLAYQLRAVLDSTIDGILLTDREGNIQLGNRPMLRYAQELAIVRDGTAVERLLSMAPQVVDRERFEATMARLRDNPDEPSMDEFELLEPRRTFQGFTGPVRGDDGATVGRIWTLREVTRERDVERLKDDFVATVSHELRTPLTSMMGFLELVREGGAGPLTADQERFLDIVHRSSERLQRLVGDLLFVARLDARGVQLDVEAVDVNEVAAEAVEAVAALARAREIGVRHVPEPVPPVQGDRARLSQVVDNLLSNAIKFTPAGGTSRRARESSRMPSSSRSRTRASGSRGTSRSGLPALLPLVVGVRPGHSRDGLGLVISKAIVEAHGGAVSVASEADKGTCVKVTLPLR